MNLLQIRNYLILIFIFMLAVPIGTLSHELGHIAVAKFLGYSTDLHYGSMSINSNNEKYDSIQKRYNYLYTLNFHEIKKGQDFSDKTEMDSLLVYLEDNKVLSLLKYPEKKDRILVTIGGPLQTMITGTLGLLVLFFKRERIIRSGLNWTDHIYVFLTLFWLRMVFNPLFWLTKFVYFRKNIVLSNHSDEIKIARYFHLNPYGFQIVLFLIALVICLMVFFKIIPIAWRKVYLISGIIGSLSGYYIWFRHIGPVLLP